MTKRERMACTLAHRQPDRVPYDQSSRSSAIEQQAYDELKRFFLGLKTPTTCYLRAHARDIEEPVHTVARHHDTRFIRYMPPIVGIATSGRPVRRRLAGSPGGDAADPYYYETGWKPFGGNRV
jgi:hypothetical protein